MPCRSFTFIISQCNCLLQDPLLWVVPAAKDLPSDWRGACSSITRTKQAPHTLATHTRQGTHQHRGTGSENSHTNRRPPLTQGRAAEDPAPSHNERKRGLRGHTGTQWRRRSGPAGGIAVVVGHNSQGRSHAPCTQDTERHRLNTRSGGWARSGAAGVARQSHGHRHGHRYKGAQKHTQVNIARLQPTRQKRRSGGGGADYVVALMAVCE